MTYVGAHEMPRVPQSGVPAFAAARKATGGDMSISHGVNGLGNLDETGNAAQHISPLRRAEQPRRRADQRSPAVASRQHRQGPSAFRERAQASFLEQMRHLLQV